jgi:hypothetical protein
MMVWTAWNNGANHKSGAGYGFKIDACDRDQFFNRDWKSITVSLPNPSAAIEVEINIDKASFWNETCRELIDREIGQWLLNNQHAPWPLRNPPKFAVKHIADRYFAIINVI